MPLTVVIRCLCSPDVSVTAGNQIQTGGLSVCQGQGDSNWMFPSDVTRQHCI